MCLILQNTEVLNRVAGHCLFFATSVNLYLLKIFRITWALVPFFSFCLSCQQAEEQPVIAPEKMQHILLDMHLAESYSMGIGDSVKHQFDRNYDSLTGFYVSILEHYEVDLPAFKQAMAWYQKYPAQMDSLYNQVINLLNELKAEKGIKEVEVEATTAPADSIQPLSPEPDRQNEQSAEAATAPVPPATLTPPPDTLSKVDSK
jgi:hypothetical protein